MSYLNDDAVADTESVRAAVPVVGRHARQAEGRRRLGSRQGSRGPRRPAGAR